MVSSHSHHQHPLRIWDARQSALMQLMMHEPSEVPALSACVLVSKTTLLCGQERIEYFDMHVQACISTMIVSQPSRKQSAVDGMSDLLACILSLDVRA